MVIDNSNDVIVFVDAAFYHQRKKSKKGKKLRKVKNQQVNTEAAYGIVAISGDRFYNISGNFVAKSSTQAERIARKTARMFFPNNSVLYNDALQPSGIIEERSRWHRDMGLGCLIRKCHNLAKGAMRNKTCIFRSYDLLTGEYVVINTYGIAES